MCSEASPRGQCLLLCLEISNLVIMRGSSAHAQPLNLSQLSFHRVHQDEITQVGILGKACGPGDVASLRGPGGVALGRGVT